MGKRGQPGSLSGCFASAWVIQQAIRFSKTMSFEVDASATQSLNVACFPASLTRAIGKLNVRDVHYMYIYVCVYNDHNTHFKIWQ